MEFTKQEEQLYQYLCKKYQRLYFRKYNVIGWIGVVLFAMGMFHIIPPDKALHKVLGNTSQWLIVISFVGMLVTVIGKLHIRVQELEKQLKRHK